MSQKISVIIPTYNNGKYLQQCLDSVSHQTYRNLEIIVVDDGSTDDTQEILEHCREKDHRLRVFYQENKGVGVARNVGLSMASGDYIAFIDSDDWVNKDYLQKLYVTLKKHDADVAVTNYFNYLDDQKATTYHLRNWDHFEKEYSPQEWMKVEYQQRDGMSEVFVSLWCKLFKAELFHNIVFPDKKFAEDDYTTWKIYLLANKIVYLNDQLYYVRVHTSSITNSIPPYFSYHAVLERIGFLKLLGLDTKLEKQAFVWRLNHQDASRINYSEYRDVALKQQLMHKYRR